MLDYNGKEYDAMQFINNAEMNKSNTPSNISSMFGESVLSTLIAKGYVFLKENMVFWTDKGLRSMTPLNQSESAEYMDDPNSSLLTS